MIPRILVLGRRWLDREFLVANLIVAIAVVTAVLLPPQAFEWRILSFQLVIFSVFPVFSVAFIMRKPLASFGFGWGVAVRGFSSVLVAALLFSGFLWAFYHPFSPILQDSFPREIFFDFGSFLKYFLTAFLFLLNTEILFRGVVLFSWGRVLGPWSVIIQTILLLVFLYLNRSASGGGDIVHMSMLYGVWSLIAGSVAYVSRSVLYSFLFSIISAIVIVVIVRVAS